MFSVRNVPVVIEPGVGALEAEFYTSDPDAGQRTIPVQLQRLDLNEAVIEDLPLIPSTRTPHLFSLNEDLKQSHVLLVYDFLGRLTTIYTRPSVPGLVGVKPSRTGWTKNNVAAEHAGRAVTQFSVRLNFNSATERTKFLSGISELAEQYANKDDIDIKTAKKVASVLARSRTAPVIMPVAVHKSDMRGIKL